jgi:NAD(P)-dependent dehydrogenase (short-subunit alcohol dehydrogenase family)
MPNTKVIVITGAGGGLGRALVSAFSKDGYTVVGIGRSQDTLDETKALPGHNLRAAFVADVAIFEQVEIVFSKIIDQFGRVDILINNAAIYPKINFLQESAHDWFGVIATNLGGVSNCCKAVLPGMIRQNFGRIYNVGSWADLDPIVNSSAYATSKGGLHALTKAIAKDISQFNADIEIHEWIPGQLETRMSDFNGISPAIAADWARSIIESSTAPSKNCIFEGNSLWIAPQSFKAKLKKKLFFWKE